MGKMVLLEEEKQQLTQKVKQLDGVLDRQQNVKNTSLSYLHELDVVKNLRAAYLLVTERQDEICALTCTEHQSINMALDENVAKYSALINSSLLVSEGVATALQKECDLIRKVRAIINDNF